MNPSKPQNNNILKIEQFKKDLEIEQIRSNAGNQFEKTTTNEILSNEKLKTYPLENILFNYETKFEENLI